MTKSKKKSNERSSPAMKSTVISSSSSSKTPATKMASIPAGYFPGCRKDANCGCKICLASINATLDLVPTGSSLTKLSVFPKRARPPPPEAEPATPPVASGIVFPTHSFFATPRIESTAKSRPQVTAGNASIERRFWVLGQWKPIVFVGAFLFAGVFLGFVEVLKEGLSPRLTNRILEQLGEESAGEAAELRGRLRILEQRVQGVVDGGVLNCSSMNSTWKMNRVGGQFFHWRCVVYESMKEEVSVWGSPLRTSGLISTWLYSRSLALLSGRITEWPTYGKLEPTCRTKSGSLWTLESGTTVAVQLESNTWVAEYKRNILFEDSKLLPTAWEVLLRLKQKLVNLDSISYVLNPPEEDNFKHPT